MVADGLHVFEFVEGQTHTHYVSLSILADLQSTTVAIGQWFEEDLKEITSFANISHSNLSHLYHFSASLHLEVLELLKKIVYYLQNAAGLQL